MTPAKITDVRRDAPQPLYLQLMERLKKMMAEMNVRGEKLLPSERNLCRLFAVSHTTVRLALKELEVSGLLLRVPGKGTFLAEPPQKDTSGALVYGVILEDLAGGRMTDFRLRLLAGIRRYVQTCDVSLMLLGEEDEIYMSLAQSGRLAGIIITNPMLSDHRLRELRQLNLPLVTIGRPPMRGIAWVDNDNVAVGRAMTEHLLERNCRKIGFIGLDRNFTVTADRLSGYKEALAKAGLSAHRNWIAFRGAGAKAGYREAAELISGGVDGIVCMDDLIALGALHYLHETGRRCPEDIALIGCNNSSFVDFSYPPLTSLEIEPERIGEEAVRTLEALRKSQDRPLGVVVPFQLLARRSTAKT